MHATAQRAGSLAAARPAAPCWAATGSSIWAAPPAATCWRASRRSSPRRRRARAWGASRPTARRNPCRAAAPCCMRSACSCAGAWRLVAHARMRVSCMRMHPLRCSALPVACPCRQACSCAPRRMQLCPAPHAAVPRGACSRTRHAASSSPPCLVTPQVQLLRPHHRQRAAHGLVRHQRGLRRVARRGVAHARGRRGRARGRGARFRAAVAGRPAAGARLRHCWPCRDQRG